MFRVGKRGKENKYLRQKRGKNEETRFILSKKESYFAFDEVSGIALCLSIQAISARAHTLTRVLNREGDCIFSRGPGAP